MIIVMQTGAKDISVDAVVQTIRQHGMTEHVSRGVERTIIGVVGDERVIEPKIFEDLPEVEKAMRVVHDWRIVSREVKAEDSHIRTRGVVFGDKKVEPINILATSDQVLLPENIGAVYYDPFAQSLSPYQIHSELTQNSWQDVLAQYKDSNKPVMLRIRDVRQLDKALKEGADILYLGSEFIDNRALQNEVRELNAPLVLEKGRQHTVKECLLVAEYIALGGNHQLMFSEAGTLHFDSDLPLRLDVEAIATFKKLSHLPVLVNLTHLGNKNISQTMLKKIACATGVDGIISSDF